MGGQTVCQLNRVLPATIWQEGHVRSAMEDVKKRRNEADYYYDLTGLANMKYRIAIAPNLSEQARENNSNGLRRRSINYLRIGRERISRKDSLLHKSEKQLHAIKENFQLVRDLISSYELTVADVDVKYYRWKMVFDDHKKRLDARYGRYMDLPDDMDMEFI